MTTDGEDQSWRNHEVPTYTQTEDTWLLGLSLRQLLGIGMSLSIAGALYQFSPLVFFPLLVRIGIAVTVGVAGVLFMVVRPGGRSMFSIISALVLFTLADKEYVDVIEDIVSSETQAEKDARLAEEGSTSLTPEKSEGWRKYIHNIPFIRRGGGDGTASAGACLMLLGASALGPMACGTREVSAQGVPEHYSGRRVFLQSVVVDFGENRDRGGRSANVRVKAAAPLNSVGPRVNQTLQSVTERESHDTRVDAAGRWVSGVGGEAGGTLVNPIPAVMGVVEETELGFYDIFLGGTAGGSPFCNIRLTEETTLAKGVPAVQQYSGAADSRDCRISPSRTRTQQDDNDTTAGPEDGISKPYVTVNWHDRMQNTGALSIDRALLPYTGPWMTEVNPIIGQGANGEIVVNPFDLCDITKVKFLSLGIQSEKPETEETYNYFGSLRGYATSPPGYSQSAGYFDGEQGRRVAGQIQTCWLNQRQEPISVILADTQVLGGGGATTEFDITVRPMVTTKDPINDVVSTAVLKIEDPAGQRIELIDIPADGDTGFFGTQPANYPTVRFNLGESFWEPLPGEPNKVRLRFSIVLTHAITVERPIYQDVERKDMRQENHITSCSCSRSTAGDTCSCSSNTTTTPVTYWEQHYRVDSAIAPSSSARFTADCTQARRSRDGPR